MKILISLLFISFISCFPGAVQAAGHPSLSDITKTWTGLEKSSRPKTLYQLTLALESSGSGVSGTLELKALSGSAAGATSVGAVEGQYFEEYGLLRFKQVGRVSHGLGVLYAVVDEDAEAMGVLLTSSFADHPPFVLYAGNTVPDEMRAILEPSAQADAGRGPTIGTTQKKPPSRGGIQDLSDLKAQRQALRSEYQANVKAAQTRIAEANLARDKAKVAELRAELKSLRSEFNQNMKALNSATASVPKSKSSESKGQGRGAGGAVGGGCPEYVGNWIGELARHGASTDYRGFLQMANLFRPSAFEPHFGRRFIEFNDVDHQALLYSMQRGCTNDGGEVARSGIRIPLRDTLGGRGKFGVPELAQAGEALDIVRGWQARALESLESEASSIRIIESFQEQAVYPLRVLWPGEQQDANSRAAIALSDRAEQKIYQLLDSYEQRLAAGDADALFDMYGLATNPLKGRFLDARKVAKTRDVPENFALFERVLEERREQVAENFRHRAEEILQAHTGRLRQQLAEEALPRARIDLGTRWFDKYGSGITLFEKTSAFKEFLPWFGETRDRDFGAARPEFLKEIAALKTLRSTTDFFHDNSLPLDLTYSENWRGIEAKLNERRAYIEREIFVARVGEGPFGPDDTGAIYLNAISRLDREQISKETEYLSYALSHTASNIGYLLSNKEVRETFLSKRGTSIVDPMLAFFAGTYFRFYPQCMEPQTVTFKRTEYFANVEHSAMYGSRVTSEFTETTIYRVNMRHASAFEYLEEVTADSAGIDMFMTLLGSNLPEHVTKNLKHLRDGLAGLQQAMQSRGCRDPVIQQLDSNLMTLFNEYHPPKNSQ